MPAWLTSPTHGTGYGLPSSPETVEFVSSANTEGTAEEHPQGDHLIWEAPQKGSPTAHWNLSNPVNGDLFVVETANCYIVNAPGYYTFPLVMGNGLKGDIAIHQVTENVGAYNPGSAFGVSGANVLTQMLDFDGRGIVNPRLGFKNDAGKMDEPETDDEYIPSYARVLWEDVNGLIETSGDDYLIADNLDQTLNAGLYWLRFRVPLGSERPSGLSDRMKGNALVAVYNRNDEIMWSWHIWVNDFRPSWNLADPVANNGDATFGAYTFMKENVGEIRFVNTYPEYTVYARLTAEDGSTFLLIKLVKAGQEGTDIVRTYNPFFQFGRKDPFIPADGKDGNNLTVYGVASMAPLPSSGSTTINIPYSIQHPFTHVNQTTNTWMSSEYYNLWNSSNETIGKCSAVVKSIYDPCPAGYKVPGANFFTDVKGGARSDVGYIFWKLEKDLSVLNIPYTGRRNANSNDYAISTGVTYTKNPGGVYGDVWTSDAYDNNNGYYIQFRHSNSSQSGGNNLTFKIRAAEGLSIRPVLDN